METHVDFSIIIDTREQAPYGFDCPTVSCMLKAGDYSVAGLTDVVAVERKSLADFASTVIHNFGRFASELEKLSRLKAACIVVEADLDSVLRGRTKDALGGISPTSLLGATVHISLRYGVGVFWCGSRQAARAFTDAYLRMFVRLNAEGSP